MSQRFGRNKKRKLQERINQLETEISRLRSDLRNMDIKGQQHTNIFMDEKYVDHRNDIHKQMVDKLAREYPELLRSHIETFAKGFKNIEFTRYLRDLHTNDTVSITKAVIPSMAVQYSTDMMSIYAYSY